MAGGGNAELSKDDVQIEMAGKRTRRPPDMSCTVQSRYIVCIYGRQRMKTDSGHSGSESTPILRRFNHIKD